MAVVMIGVCVREFVVMTMQANPVDGSVLAAQCPTGGEETLQPFGNGEGSVREQAVIADRHAETGGDPVKDQCGADRLPAPETGEQRNDAQDMDRDHESDRSPAGAFGYQLFTLTWPVQPTCKLHRKMRCYWPAGGCSGVDHT